MDKLNFSKIKAIKSQGDSNFSMLINMASFVTEQSSCVHVMLTADVCVYLPKYGLKV